MKLKWFFILTFVAVLILASYGQKGATGNSVLSEQNIDKDASQITMSKEAADILNKNYRESTTEFAACLDVKQHLVYNEDNTDLDTFYEIIDIKEIVTSSGDNYISQGYCENGLVHAHKGGSCVFSLTDIYSIKEHFRNGEIFSVLMCGEDKFYYITRNDYKEKEIKIN